MEREEALLKYLQDNFDETYTEVTKPTNILFVGLAYKHFKKARQ